LRSNNFFSGNNERKIECLNSLLSLGKISKKRFLKLSGLALGALACSAGCGREESREFSDWKPLPVLRKPPPPKGDVVVSVVRSESRSESIIQAVERAIELAGGLDEIKSGDTVMIKPNLTTGYAVATRVTTHPELLRGVIRAVKKRTDAKNITVAEASSYADPSTLAVAQKVGVYDVVLQEGVGFLPWEDEEYVEATCFDFQHIDFRVNLPVSIMEGRFKHFINVPMLKNHEAISISNAEFTCCIKNHVGVLERSDRTRGGGTGIHHRNLGEAVAELNLAIPRYVMNVVDALTVVVSGGPASSLMRWTEPGLIIASKDRVACDSLGVAILRREVSRLGVNKPYVAKSVWEQAQIVRARELNLGRGPENIRITSEGIPDFDDILKWWN